MTPTVSIVISGFGSRGASWDRLRNCLRAVAAQDVAGQVEVVLLDMPELNRELPGDIRDLIPQLRQVSCASVDPWVRKSAGARSATAPILVFLDADCVPEDGWLSSMIETFRFYPEVAVVRGCVEEDGLNWRRLVPERRVAGPTAATAENNIAFRRDAYLDCPFLEGSGVDAVRYQTAALRRAHYVLWAEPRMQASRERIPRKLPIGVRIRYSTAASR
ncbi:MAG: glycosyltransferase family 2 protein [Bryobacteraceae bacterium]